MSLNQVRKREPAPPALRRISQSYPALKDAQRKVADLIQSDPAGVKGLPITKIGSLCGVSQGTVVNFCRALGYSGYSSFKLALVEELADSHNPRTSALGGNEAETPRYRRDREPDINRTLHIGVAVVSVLQGFGDPVVKRLLDGMNAGAHDRKVLLHILSIPEAKTSVIDDGFIDIVPLDGLDGVVLLSPASSLVVGRLLSLRIPFVSTNLIPDRNVVCHTVDEYHARYLLTSALLKRGAKRIAACVGDPNNLAAQARLSGYKQALQAAGVPYDERLVVYEDYDNERAIECLRKLDEDSCTFDGVIAWDDIMAGIIVDYLSLTDRSRIPVAGSGNIESCKDKVAITTDEGYFDIGVDLMRSLVKIMDGVKLDRTKYMYEPALIER